MTGVSLTHVPYKGQPEALTDLLGARVSMMALTVAIAKPHVQSGKLHAPAITSSRRSPALPGVPTVAVAANIPGYEVSAWFGFVAPRKTPDAVVNKLADAEACAGRSATRTVAHGALRNSACDVAPAIGACVRPPYRRRIRQVVPGAEDRRHRRAMMSRCAARGHALRAAAMSFVNPPSFPTAMIRNSAQLQALLDTIRQFVIER
ncbi:tripartite tricarboxylate transporter substrate-binding protein [Cupriavidus basilensis]